LEIATAAFLWALVRDPGFLDFQVFRFSIIEIFVF